MSSNPTNTIKRTEPIAIGGQRQGRGRSVSVSSASSSSSYSPVEPVTPAQSNPSYPSLSPSNASPVLSYFLAQSQSAPNKSPQGSNSFPFRRFGSVAQAPVFEEEETKFELPATAHARRASVANPIRFGSSTTNPVPIPEAQMERGTNMLRRLSLSGGYTKSPPSPPAPPPNSAVSPTPMDGTPFRGGKPRRSATLSAGSGKVRRAPSPMGERILKGHFDGFN